MDKLAQGVAMIAAAFYPEGRHPAAERFQDERIRQPDRRPRLRAGRGKPDDRLPRRIALLQPALPRGFALECRAMKKVRDEMGLTNLKLMIPFCRTVEEGRRVQAEMAKHGLRRGEDGLEVYVMCEIPSNVILAEEFAEIFDGFSHRLERPDAAHPRRRPRHRDRRADLRRAKRRGEEDDRAASSRRPRAKGRKIGICGQAPSDYPEFAQFLVEQGIDSISLNPDTVLKTTVAILEKERETNRTP